MKLHRRMPLLLCVALAGVCSGQAKEAETIRHEGITRTNTEVILSFTQPGQVAEICVREGQAVRAGQVLMRQDDQVERAWLAQLKAEAENKIRIKAAEAELKQKQVELDRVRDLLARGVATRWEHEKAKADKLMSELSVQLAKFNLTQARLKYAEAQARMKRMVLHSPIEGVVARIMTDPGESVQQQDKVIGVVSLDPLWIDVPVPLAQAETIHSKRDVLVYFPRTDSPRRGKIIHKSPVADAASGTLAIRVEVPNPAARPAGERVKVEFYPSRGDSSERSSSVSEPADSNRSGTPGKDSGDASGQRPADQSPSTD